MGNVPKLSHKVSVKQLIMIIIVTSISPAVRFLSTYTAGIAEEAAWVSPIPAMAVVFLTIYFIHIIFSKNPSKSTSEIIRDILGKYMGTAAIAVHFLWILFLLVYYVRFNAERMVSSIYPNVQMIVFAATTLVVVSHVLRSGETPIARMAEILLPILSILFVFVTLFLLPKIRIDAILPVYFNNTLPVLKASLGTISLFSFLFVVFFFSDTITGKQNIWRIFSKGAIVLFIMLMALLLTTVGVLGSSVAKRAPVPFLIIVKQISVLDTIENIESIVVAMWILADSILIASFATLLLNISKVLFKLSDTMNLIRILFVFVFIAALCLSTDKLQLDIMSLKVLPILNPLIGIGTPALLFIVGKLRKKL